jgi:hypothetical protein
VSALPSPLWAVKLQTQANTPIATTADIALADIDHSLLKVRFLTVSRYRIYAGT